MMSIQKRNNFQQAQRSVVTVTLVVLTAGVVVTSMFTPALAIQTSDTHNNQEVIEIEDWYDLAEIDANQRSLHQHYKLVNDLDENTPGYGGNGESGVVLNAEGELRAGTGFSRIGYANNEFIGFFEGTFDGNGHKISDLRINHQGEDKTLIGLFAKVTGEGTVTDLEINDGVVKGGTNVGLLAGEVKKATIENITVSGSVKGDQKVGGVVGYNNDGFREGAYLYNITVDTNVTGESNVGGVVGTNERSSLNQISGEVDVRGYETDVGGVVGENRGGYITNLHIDTSVQSVGAGTSINFGGVVGWNEGVVKKSAITTNVTTGGNNIGGIVGLNTARGEVVKSTIGGVVYGSANVGGASGVNSNEAVISEVGVTAEINAEGAGVNMGGVVGSSRALTENTYFKGEVAGTKNVGGIAGELSTGFTTSGTITDSFVAGSVDGKIAIGPITGMIEGDSVINDVYWDTQRTNLTDSQSMSQGNGLETEQLQGKFAETNMTTLSYGSVWNTTDSYPKLVFESSISKSDQMKRQPSSEIDFEEQLYEDIEDLTNQIISLIK